MNIVEAISPNRWPGALPSVKYGVMHTTQGTSSLGWLRNPASQVSAQYLVPKEGPDIYRLVPDGDAAWHAGLTYEPRTPLFDGVNPNLRAYGVELEGFAAEPITPFQIETAVALINRYGVPFCMHADLATGGPYYRSDPGIANFAAIVAAQEGMGVFTQAQIAWLDDFVKGTIRVMLTSDEGKGLVEFAIRQPGGYGSKLQAWIDKYLVYRVLGKMPKGKAAVTRRRNTVKKDSPFSPIAVPTGQKGEWPKELGPEPKPRT